MKISHTFWCKVIWKGNHGTWSQQFDETVCINDSFTWIYAVFKHSVCVMKKFLAHISFSKGEWQFKEEYFALYCLLQLHHAV